MTQARNKPNRNHVAGRLVQELRTDKGLSAEALSYAIYRAGHGSVSARTIYRVESQGLIPRVRTQFAIAQFFGRPVTQIWPVPSARKAVTT